MSILMKLPSDIRFIPLKYTGRCPSCSKPIKAGQKAHWSPSSKKIWCEDCVRVDNNSRVPSQSETGDSRYVGNTTNFAGAQRTETTHVDNHQARWRRLCRYAQRCIEAEAAKSLIPYVQENSHWFVHCGQEKLVVGHSDAISAPKSLADYLSRSHRRDGQSIIYGWPTVVITDRDHSPKVAPLLLSISNLNGTKKTSGNYAQLSNLSSIWLSRRARSSILLSRKTSTNYLVMAYRLAMPLPSPPWPVVRLSCLDWTSNHDSIRYRSKP